MIRLHHKLKHCLITAFLGITLFALNPLATSAVLVSQPYLAGGDSFLSTISGGFENAESLVLPGAVNVTSLIWWGTDVVDTSDFLVRLGSSLGGWTDLSGTTAKSTTGDVDSENRAIFQFEQTLNTALPLAAGNHFLSISNEAEDWFWTVGSLDAAFGVTGSFFGAAPDWFDDDSNELSFQLIGERQTQAVPEPGSLVLLSLGLLGLIASHRHKR